MPLHVRRGHVVFAPDGAVVDKSWSQMTPAERAAEWRRIQARWLHIVDLMRDGLRETAGGKLIPDERQRHS